MQISPQNSKILIKIEEKETTKSGLVIATKNHIITEIAEVLAVGEKVEKIKVGDKIMYKSWALDVIVNEDKKYSFLDEKDVIALIS